MMCVEEACIHGSCRLTLKMSLCYIKFVANTGYNATKILDLCMIGLPTFFQRPTRGNLRHKTCDAKTLKKLYSLVLNQRSALLYAVPIGVKIKSFESYLACRDLNQIPPAIYQAALESSVRVEGVLSGPNRTRQSGAKHAKESDQLPPNLYGSMGWTGP